VCVVCEWLCMECEVYECEWSVCGVCVYVMGRYKSDGSVCNECVCV